MQSPSPCAKKNHTNFTHRNVKKKHVFKMKHIDVNKAHITIEHQGNKDNSSETFFVCFFVFGFVMARTCRYWTFNHNHV